MTIDHRRMLMQELGSWHKDYNPGLHMVRRPFSSPGYHTTLKGVTHTHPTLAACIYALALLDSGEQAYTERASDLLRKVIGLQDQKRDSATFGIWSWFMEEPLSMMAPPDWNWADFCGKRLVLAEQRHGQRLSPSLREQIRHAVFCACDAIIKRNVGPGYTNIAIMGAFVTLIAGEVYGVDRYADYGLERLRKFSDYTRELGTFQEFNSPTYTVVAIQELSSIHTSTRLPEAKRLSADMLDVAWSMIAEHYHAPTGEWSGPHSRSYSTMMTDAVRSFLQMACGDTVPMLPEDHMSYSLDWYENDIQCPPDYRAAFREGQGGEYRQVIHRDAGGMAVNTATTYKDERVSLGTFSKDVMWNQRRNLLAYVRNGDRFSYIHLRFLHDGYDYSSAVFSCRQEGADALFGIGFCTNGGDTHIGLDPIDGTLEAADLRLRFEIGGRLEGVEARLTEEAGAVHVSLDGGALAMQAAVLFAAFDGETPRWEIGRIGEKLNVDYVVYAGDTKRFDFRSLQEALLVLAFRLGGGEGGGLDASAERTVPGSDMAKEAPGAPVAGTDGGTFAEQWADADGPQVHAAYRTASGSVLTLTLPLKPATKQQMLR
ncbi:hypothetical protein ACFQI7_00135 [Paenibacillus allorhizosphaerae]|uniref:Heparinase n=1 Tax=Paenibacillus allorhizosphaerae TaxID=2849866 RepID=A0ABN7TV84_9BACL|nr:hypothetical protein [Paenibacillus allorhizosphaerae]CAG7656916.1 hypothetical protein PAECIP111802_06561 [Paenibacillus allorhizosphaerae]